MKPREPLIFEKGSKDRKGVILKEKGIPLKEPHKILDRRFLREKELDLPSLSELEVVRHYTRISQLNFSVDTHFYPLGSCTMKYNPKVDEDAASLEGFKDIHPFFPQEYLQGILGLIYNLEMKLAQITGMSKFTFQPSAGAHGELTGMLIIRKYHTLKGNRRSKVIVPDSSHGTNPASSSMCGYKVVEVKSDPQGLVDIDALQKIMDEDTAGLMLTNPNTLGLFEEKIIDIAEIVHRKGGLLYYDGANLNPLLGIVRVRDMGFDVMHINLHKTFSTPHGAGGPGSGPVGVSEKLVEYLPVPLVDRDSQGNYFLNYNLKHSIGRVRSFLGNIPVLIKAYAYLLRLGEEGLKRVAQYSVLNANYIREKLKKHYYLPYDKLCMHEVVFSAKYQKEKGVSALDIAKRLIDYNIHPPTVYFPLIVKEALMIEPTETESKQTLDNFIEIMVKINEEADKDPQVLHESPHDTPVRRLDEVYASRHPQIIWQKKTGD